MEGVAISSARGLALSTREALDGDPWQIQGHRPDQPSTSGHGGVVTWGGGICTASWMTVGSPLVIFSRWIKSGGCVCVCVCVCVSGVKPCQLVL